MGYEYKSVLRNEFLSFMELIKVSVIDHKAYQRSLSSFDAFLYAEDLEEKQLDGRQVKRWLDSFVVKPATKQSKLTHIRKFSEYLTSIGIKATLPELPRIPSDFEPYVFTMEEVERIFEAADDLTILKPRSRAAAEFPFLLRLLYGCGLRLGEALSLTWDDIDLDEGVITIRIAKNNKQRIVPMEEELLRIMRLYRAAPCFGMKAHDLLFRQDNGKRRNGGAYWSLLDTILCELGIKNAQTAKPGERGPCLHSFRHTFAMHSLLKAEAEGCVFMDSVPFLSTYMGHEGLMETDKYLRARYELYSGAHAMIASYTGNVFPEEV